MADVGGRSDTRNDGDSNSRLPVALATPGSAAVDSRSSASFVLSLSEFKHVDPAPSGYEPGVPSSRPSPFSAAQGGSRRDAHPRLWVSLLEPPCAEEKGKGLQLGPPGSYQAGTASTCLTSDNGRTKLALDPESTAAEQGVARATGNLELKSPSCSVAASTSNVGHPIQLGSATDAPYYVVTSATSWEDYTASVEPATTRMANQQVVPHRRGQDEGGALLEPPCATEKGDDLELGPPGSYLAGTASTCLNSNNDRAKTALDRYF